MGKFLFVGGYLDGKIKGVSGKPAFYQSGVIQLNGETFEIENSEHAQKVARDPGFFLENYRLSECVMVTELGVPIVFYYRIQSLPADAAVKRFAALYSELDKE